MVRSVVETSHKSGQIEMDPDHLVAMGELRDFMFEKVYLRPESTEQKEKAILIIQDLVRYYEEHSQEVPDSFTLGDADPLTRAVDYVAGMTDRFALTSHARIYRPTLLD